jgi:hypothetical protein
VKRHFGQAGLVVADIAHGLARLFLLLLTLLLLSICLLGLRLAAGPLEIPYLASKLATAVSGQGITVKIDQADLAWAGYRQGGGVPLILLLGGIVVTNSAGVELVEIPSAKLSFLPVSLLGPDAPILVTATNARFPGSAVPASLRAAIRLNTGFSLSRAALTVTLGAGRLGSGVNSFPIRSGGFGLTVTPGSVAVKDGFLAAAASGGSAPSISFAGAAVRAPDLWHGSLRLTIDRVQAADLPVYWPPGILPQTRAWVTGHIAGGVADHGDVTAGLTAPLSLAAIHIAAASGGFDAENLTLGWLPGAPPITGMNGRLGFLDAGNILITASSARLGGLALSAGQMKISGLDGPRQKGDLQLHVAGAIPDLAAVLGSLGLLRAAPPQIPLATGQVAADVSADIPFIRNLKLAQVGLHVAAHLSDVAVDSPFAGLRFTGGQADLQASTQAMSVHAASLFAGEPATFDLAVDFDAPPAMRSLHLSGRAGPQILAFLGVAGGTAVSGPVSGTAPFTLTLTTAADGSQTGLVDADLTPVALAAPAFGWAKPAGVAGMLAASAAFQNHAVGALLALRAQAPGLDLQAQAAGPKDFVVSRADVGRTRAVGEILGPGADGAWLATFSGPMLEFQVAPKPAKGPQAAPAAPSDAPPSGPVWSLALNFQTVALAAAPAPLLKNFRLAGDLTGAFLRQAKISATGLALTFAPASAGGPRRVHVVLRAADGGALLRAAGVYGNVQGGGLALEEDEGGTAPAQGVVHLDNFRLMKVPVMAKILQGLTIYGIGAATSGPGLQIDHLVAPFSVGDGVLTLAGARAFSSSIGFTASGTIRLDDDVADLDATVVPAYALNTLPGKIPMIGPLFTAETGGGLISVRVRILGAMSDPAVMVNPLSALTPGVFRNLFGTGGSH